MQSGLTSYIKFWFLTEKKETCVSWTKIDSKNSVNGIVCNDLGYST